MEWNDELLDGKVKVEPVAGALVRFCDDLDGQDGPWMLLKPYEPEALKGQGILAYSMFHNPPDECARELTPLLPAVPAGMTCWDVMHTLHDGKKRGSAYMTVFPLDAGGIYVVEQSWGIDCDYVTTDQQGIVSPSQYQAHMRDMQKYGALLEWIKVNSHE